MQERFFQPQVSRFLWRPVLHISQSVEATTGNPTKSPVSYQHFLPSILLFTKWHTLTNVKQLARKAFVSCAKPRVTRSTFRAQIREWHNIPYLGTTVDYSLWLMCCLLKSWLNTICYTWLAFLIGYVLCVLLLKRWFGITMYILYIIKDAT